MPFDYQPFLKSDLVELRPLRKDDYEALFAVASDPLIWEQHPVKTRSTEPGFRQYFEESFASGGALVIIDTKSQKIIGSSRYWMYDNTKNEVEIGWTFLARAYWGGIYNKQVKDLMIRHAFIFVKTIVFKVGINNIRSQKAVEKLGAVRFDKITVESGRESYIYKLGNNIKS